SRGSKHAEIWGDSYCAAVRHGRSGANRAEPGHRCGRRRDRGGAWCRWSHRRRKSLLCTQHVGRSRWRG
ncbi:hypothetical protein OY671_012733, partial [Metschnikowia pulcherrima]